MISSNLQIRQRGDGFYSNQKVEDKGIAVYFKLKGKDKVMACDKWDKISDNIWSLCKSIEAIRGLERWGGSEFLDGLFTGFTALPDPDSVSVGIPQYFADCEDKEHARSRYKSMAKEMHPDRGGNAAEFSEMKRQYDAYMNR